MGASGLLGLKAVAQAAIPPAPEVRAALPQAQRAGATRLVVWGFDVYDASLWVAPDFRADAWERNSFALELRYLRSFDGDDIAGRSLREMRRAGPLTPGQAIEWLRAMQSIFPDVRKGDRLVGIHEPAVGATFFHNGAPRGQLRDPAFAERFFAIWLGPQTSEPALRAALLAPLAR